jgi:hypothetical protein
VHLEAHIGHACPCFCIAPKSRLLATGRSWSDRRTYFICKHIASRFLLDLQTVCHGSNIL